MGSIRRLSGVTVLTIAVLLVFVAPGASQRQRSAPPMEVERAAQGWSGAAGVGVEVRDRDGDPIEGAQVQLAFAESMDGDGGPAAVMTDASGRAAVRGLAEGEWVLTVRHPQTMAYVATLEVRKGKRPHETTASQVKVGDSLRPLRLKYFEASGPAERPMHTEPEGAPAQAAPPIEPAAPPRAHAPAAEPPAEQPEAAPTWDSGAMSEPETAAAPEPEEPRVETEQPPMAEPAPAGEPMPAPQPEPPPVSRPAAKPSVASQPAAESSAAAPRRSTLRSYEAGTCPECRPREWSVTAEGSAAPGSGTCPDDLEARIDRAAALLGSARALGPWTGPIELAGGASSVLGSEAYGQFTQAIRDVLADDATCRVLAVMLPAGATFVGLEIAADDDGAWQLCLPGRECVAGSGWIGDPWVVRTPAGPMVAGAYGNGGTQPRRVRLTVYFTAPEGWAPR